MSPQELKTAQLVLGSVTALLCVWGVWRADWMVSETRKGRWLVRRAGMPAARNVIRVFLALLATAAVLLAADVIRPVQW